MAQPNTEIAAPPAGRTPAPVESRPRINSPWAGYRNLVITGLKLLRREPQAIFWVFIFPIFMAVGLGLATRNRPPEALHVAVVTGTAGSDRALELLKPSIDKGSVSARALSAGEALDGFRLGKYDLVLTPGADGSFQYRYDPARPSSMLARVTVDDAIESAAGRKDPVSTSAHVSSEPGSRYIDFLIPGLLGMNLLTSGLWGIGFGLVEMRQRKLLKRYVATPMRRGHFLMALASSRLILSALQLFVVLGFGVVAFQVRVVGSWASILLLSALGALSFGALGLLTASRAEKIETASGLINFVSLPMWILCGVFFSYDGFPAAIQPFIKALPLTAFNDAMRAIVLEGAPLAAQLSRLAILAVWGIVCYVLAVRWFRWT